MVPEELALALAVEIEDGNIIICRQSVNHEGPVA